MIKALFFFLLTVSFAATSVLEAPTAQLKVAYRGTLIVTAGLPDGQ